MKTKLVFSTEKGDIEYWADLPFIPRLKEWLNLTEIISTKLLDQIKQSATCWSGLKGLVDAVEYRQNDSGYYAEVLIWCED